ncbi:GP88 family protein [Virgisporangium aurantiacum]
MPDSAPPPGGAPQRPHDPSAPDRPRRLLTQNREMKAIGVWNWTLPAWAGRFADGRTYNTCPSAGICAHVCYARNGTYRWPVVLARHQANLRYVLDDLAGWEAAMVAELGARRFAGAWIRIHDSGDFFSDDYLQAWLRICHARPNVNFYAYTKEVDRFRRLVEPDPPPNFLWVYSYGGTQDHRLDPRVDRVADVFPDEQAIAAAGWHSQEASDLLAVLGPSLVGIPANRIPTFLKRLRGRRFSAWQAEADAERAARRHRRQPADTVPAAPAAPEHASGTAPAA